MDAREALHRLATRYRSLVRYRDNGEVMLYGAESGPTRSTFTTEFSRSIGLTFRFLHASYTIELVGTSQGALVSSQGLSPAPTTLSDTILAAKGVTFTAAYLVPPMLLPGILVGRTIADASDPELKGKETINGEPCFVIKLAPGWADGEVLVSESSFALCLFRVRKLQFGREMAERARLAGIYVEPRVTNAEFSLVVTYESELEDGDDPPSTLDLGPEP
jgi:hypothetical protein